MLSFLVNAAYSTVTGIFWSNNDFMNALWCNFYPCWHNDWWCQKVTEQVSSSCTGATHTVKIHLRWQVCTSISKRWPGRSVIFTVNKHTDRLITPFAVMYAHMFSHTSTETRKSHTYCQIPGYWASLGILLSDMWVAEHKANSAGVYNWRMLLVSAAVHRWL